MYSINTAHRICVNKQLYFHTCLFFCDLYFFSFSQLITMLVWFAAYGCVPMLIFGLISEDFTKFRRECFLSCNLGISNVKCFFCCKRTLHNGMTRRPEVSDTGKTSDLKLQVKKSNIGISRADFSTVTECM